MRGAVLLFLLYAIVAWTGTVVCTLDDVEAGGSGLS